MDRVPPELIQLLSSRTNKSTAFIEHIVQNTKNLEDHFSGLEFDSRAGGYNIIDTVNLLPPVGLESAALLRAAEKTSALNEVFIPPSLHSDIDNIDGLRRRQIELDILADRSIRNYRKSNIKVNDTETQTQKDLKWAVSLANRFAQGKK
ncbi:hypothetical protein F7U66_18770 [Vibrio parahaemolyticus]|nr:hypothetical protein [Vibrio parahaemolyticus]